jgi:hypothetical protein
MGYMLAKLQVRYGELALFNEIMPHVVSAAEAQGWKLLGAYTTAIGRFYEVWDLWDVGGDAGAITQGLAAVRRDPEAANWAARLRECLESEEVRYLEKLPYSP